MPSYNCARLRCRTIPSYNTTQTCRFRTIFSYDTKVWNLLCAATIRLPYTKEQNYAKLQLYTLDLSKDLPLLFLGWKYDTST